MHGLSPQDGGNEIDWGRTSEDYAAHRPGPPASFYAKLAAHEVGLPEQSILDLATGTGLLARQFARQGAVVCGIDISEGQISVAQRLAREEGLEIDLRVGPAESLPWADETFDVAIANQAWLYFDKPRMIVELRRVLKPGGTLVTSHFSWLSRRDEIARRTEALVLKFNPAWSAADWSGEIPACPLWAERDFDVRAMFYYDEPIAFTRESWRGRIRACRGVGAALPEEQVAAFDTALAELLEQTAPETFTVLHRIDAHLFQFKV